MMAVCAILSGSLLFSSCIGSFGLWNNLKSWNQGIGNKFVNEIVFLAFHIVPVYEVAYLADILVLNSIEFWSGSNPVAEVGTIKTVRRIEMRLLIGNRRQQLPIPSDVFRMFLEKRVIRGNMSILYLRNICGKRSLA